MGAFGDLLGTGAEAGLEVVGAEQEDHHVERPVRLQAGRQGAQRVAVGAFDRVVTADGATGQTVLDDVPVRAERGLQHTGPALAAAEAAGVVAGAHRLGAVGVGVAEAQQGVGSGHLGNLQC